MSVEGGKLKLTQKRRKRLAKRSITNLIMMEYDGMENIRKMLSSMGYILKSKQVEENEISQLSSVLTENVTLLEENILPTSPCFTPIPACGLSTKALIYLPICCDKSGKYFCCSFSTYSFLLKNQTS